MFRIENEFKQLSEIKNPPSEKKNNESYTYKIHNTAIMAGTMVHIYYCVKHFILK